MQWHFFPQLARYVETGVTQRDQFRNDEVDLYDTIVREAVQNHWTPRPVGIRPRSYSDGSGPTAVPAPISSMACYMTSWITPVHPASSSTR